MKIISIIVPVYNEAETIKFFYKELASQLRKSNYDFEIIFAVDPGYDRTEEIIKEIVQEDERVKMIELTRKFGQAAAILCGLENCVGDAAIIMDADLQDPPFVIHSMLEKWEQNNLIVLAVRNQRRGDNFVKLAVSKLGYFFLNKFAEVPLPKNVGDFRLLDRKIVNLLEYFPESKIYLRGLISLIGFPYEIVHFERPPRILGKSKYNKYVGSLSIALDGIVGFSNLLLKFSIYSGILIAIMSIIIGLSYLTLKFFGFPFPIGNPTIVSLVLFMGALNLLSVGIVGMYVGRIADDVKRRPRYLIKNRINF